LFIDRTVLGAAIGPQLSGHGFIGFHFHFQIATHAQPHPLTPPGDIYWPAAAAVAAADDDLFVLCQL